MATGTGCSETEIENARNNFQETKRELISNMCSKKSILLDFHYRAIEAEDRLYKLCKSYEERIVSDHSKTTYVSSPELDSPSGKSYEERIVSDHSKTTYVSSPELDSPSGNSDKLPLGKVLICDRHWSHDIPSSTPNECEGSLAYDEYSHCEAEGREKKISLIAKMKSELESTTTGEHILNLWDTDGTDHAMVFRPCEKFIEQATVSFEYFNLDFEYDPLCDDLCRTRIEENLENMNDLLGVLLAVLKTRSIEIHNPQFHSVVASLAILAAQEGCPSIAITCYTIIRSWGRSSNMERKFLENGSCTYDVVALRLLRTYIKLALNSRLKVVGGPRNFLAYFQANNPAFNVTQRMFDRLLHRACGIRRQWDSTEPEKAESSERDVLQTLAEMALIFGSGNTERELLCRSQWHKYYERRCMNYITDRFRADECFLSKVDLLSSSLYPFNLLRHFDNVLSLLDQEQKVNIGADESYELRFVQPIPCSHDVIALRSACGTGKSTAVRNYLGSSDFAGMPQIWVSFRKSLSAETSQKLGDTWKNYDDINGGIDMKVHRRLIVQVESLGRILPVLEPFILVLDELHAVLAQLESKCGNFSMTQSIFCTLCKQAHRIVAMDGFLDQNRIEVLERFRGAEGAWVIHNTFKFRRDHMVYIASTVIDCVQSLINLLVRGQRAHVPCFSKRLGNKVYGTLKERFNDSKKILFYNQENPWDRHHDVNSVWAEADVVMHTPTFTCGVSYEGKKFDWCIGFFANSQAMTHETALQMASRCRETKQFLFCLPRTENDGADISKKHILKEISPRVVARTNVAFHGCTAKWVGSRSNSVLGLCNPFIFNMVTNRHEMEVSKRFFGDKILDCLISDGACCMDFPSLCVEITTKKEFKKQNEVVVSRAMISSLANRYDPTPEDVFSQMNPETISKFDREKIVRGYRNTLYIRLHGPDFQTSLNFIKDNLNRFTNSTEICRESSLLQANETSLIATEYQLQVRGSSLYKASLVISEMLQLFTGSEDPFQSIEKFQSQIQSNLGIGSEPWQSDSFVHDEVQNHIFRLYADWKLHDPENAPLRSIRKEGRLTLKKAVTILNHMLVTFGLNLHRKSRKQKRSRGCKPDYLYSLGHPDFQEASDPRPWTRPVLFPWKKDVSKLQDSQLLRVVHRDGESIVLPGRLAHLPGKAFGNSRFLGSGRAEKNIELDDIMPLHVNATSNQQDQEIINLQFKAWKHAEFDPWVKAELQYDGWCSQAGAVSVEVPKYWELFESNPRVEAESSATATCEACIGGGEGTAGSRLTGGGGLGGGCGGSRVTKPAGALLASSRKRGKRPQPEVDGSGWMQQQKARLDEKQTRHDSALPPWSNGMKY